MTNLGDEGRWHLAVGDPTPLGWLTFGAYMLAVILCWRAYQSSVVGACMQAASSPIEADRQRLLGWWWLGLAALMLLLGLNKQADLQTLLTEVGKDLARTQGWYAERRRVQFAFVAILALALVTTGFAVALALRSVLRQIWPALLGLALILAFVELRAALFNVLRRESGTDTLQDLWLLELGGVGLVIWNAHRAVLPIGRGGA